MTTSSYLVSVNENTFLVSDAPLEKGDRVLDQVSKKVLIWPVEDPYADCIKIVKDLEDNAQFKKYKHECTN
jgi:hypothetical protein